MTTELTLGFDGLSRTKGGYPVIDSDGVTVATVRPGFWLARFDATGTDDRPLCSGRARLVSGWRGFDADGKRTVTYRVGLDRRHRVELSDGTRLRLRGRPFTSGWHAVDETTDQVRLEGNLGGERGLFGSTVFVVHTDGTLPLDLTVAVVELSRLQLRKTRRRPTRRDRPSQRRVELFPRRFG